jgi:hypothetical protein
MEDSDFVSVTRTPEELSIVADSRLVPSGVSCEAGWNRIEVQGPLSFDQTGVIAGLVAPLARAGIGVFVVSTFDTDHLLVKSDRLADAIATLENEGHTVYPAGRSGR